MKLAIIGIRGIPVVYSGFETLAENLSTKLVTKGHQVTVYCRSGYVKENKKEYQGVRLIILPSIKSKSLETFIHSFISTLHLCLTKQADIVYYLGVGSAGFSLLPKILGIKTLVNVDGLDWRRSKWGSFGKIYLYLSEYFASWWSDQIITDSLFMKNYYQKNFNKITHYIPYGYQENKISKTNTILRKYRLQKRKYFIWVGRLVPDNHLEELLKEFSKISSTYKCVVIGDDIVNSPYKRHMLSWKDSKIIFTGFLPRKDYAYLVKSAFAYIETKRSGGTHPSLVEAMGFGSLIIANDHPTTKEVLEETACYYSLRSAEDKLSKAIKKSLLLKPNTIKNYRQLTKIRAQEKYSWPAIIKTYEKLLKNLATQSP